MTEERQENKARQIFRKTNISYPLIRTCAYQRVRNVRFQENLARFVFLKHPFWDSPLSLIAEEISSKCDKYRSWIDWSIEWDSWFSSAGFLRKNPVRTLPMIPRAITSQKRNFSINDFFSEYYQIRRELHICTHLLNISSEGNLFFLHWI